MERCVDKVLKAVWLATFSKNACWQGIKAARGGFQMLSNVLQDFFFFSADKIRFCHATCIDF